MVSGEAARSELVLLGAATLSVQPRRKVPVLARFQVLSTELQAAQALNRRNVRHLRPAGCAVPINDADTNVFLGHGLVS